MNKREILTSLIGQEVQIYVPHDHDGIFIAPKMPSARLHVIREVGDDLFGATDPHGVLTYYSIGHIIQIHVSDASTTSGDSD